jgi:hypothetical protein
MKEAKLKEDLFGRLLGKESIVEPLLVGKSVLTQTQPTQAMGNRLEARHTPQFTKPFRMSRKEV